MMEAVAIVRLDREEVLKAVEQYVANKGFSPKYANNHMIYLGRLLPETETLDIYVSNPIQEFK